MIGCSHGTTGVDRERGCLRCLWRPGSVFPIDCVMPTLHHCPVHCLYRRKWLGTRFLHIRPLVFYEAPKMSTSKLLFRLFQVKHIMCFHEFGWVLLILFISAIYNRTTFAKCPVNIGQSHLTAQPKPCLFLLERALIPPGCLLCSYCRSEGQTDKDGERH